MATQPKKVECYTINELSLKKIPTRITKVSRISDRAPRKPLTFQWYKVYAKLYRNDWREVRQHKTRELIFETQEEAEQFIRYLVKWTKPQEVIVKTFYKYTDDNDII